MLKDGVMSHINFHDRFTSFSLKSSVVLLVRVNLFHPSSNQPIASQRLFQESTWQGTCIQIPHERIPSMSRLLCCTALIGLAMPVAV